MTIFFLFLFGYIINMFYISVLYHRGLAHGSVKLQPKILKLLQKTGVWVTGLDPLSWTLMHRVHHKYSDRKMDPHSPLNGGIFMVWISQYKSYLYFFERMKTKDNAELNEMISDIPFGASNVSSNLPYVLQILFSIAIAYFFQSWLAGVAWFVGIMGHPIQGWMINALAHKYGGRNFNTDDNSKNNLILGYLIFGEGYQNNHHAHPERANFAFKFPEFDPGFVLCKFCSKMNWIKL
jgi:stearoyl-CoA desaturase (delta-9 desaturase)